MALSQLWLDGEYVKYAQTRRVMIRHRADELLAALETFASLDHAPNLPELEDRGISFAGMLDTGQVHYMGHSFGASTVLHAAHSRRHSFRAPRPATVIAHDPVSDWLPDDTRRSLFDDRRLRGGRYYGEFAGFTGDDVRAEGQMENDGAEDKTSAAAATTTTKTSPPSIHDLHMLVLSSHEWSTKRWGASHILSDMHERGLFGARSNANTEQRGDGGVLISRVQVIDKAHHSEFSDTSMLTPLWLTRAVNLTGSRNPSDTAREIHQRTLDCLRDWESVHKKLKAGQPTGENLIRDDKANKFRTFVEYLSALLL